MITEAIARRALDQYKGKLLLPFVESSEVRKTPTGNYVIVLTLRRPLARGEYTLNRVVVNDFGRNHQVIVKTEIKRG